MNKKPPDRPSHRRQGMLTCILKKRDGKLRAGYVGFGAETIDGLLWIR